MPVIRHSKLTSTTILTAQSPSPEPPDRVIVHLLNEGDGAVEVEYVPTSRAERAEALLERITHADDRHADYWTHEIARVLDAR
jgi:hypothetical protein